MAKFLLGNTEETEVFTNRIQVFWMVDFQLPEAVSDHLAVAELAQIQGRFCMGFYCDPLPGDVLAYKGYLWKVTGRVIQPTRYRSRDTKHIPEVLVEFLAEA